jgi:hypothetical protein
MATSKGMRDPRARPGDGRRGIAAMTGKPGLPGKPVLRDAGKDEAIAADCLIRDPDGGPILFSLAHGGLDDAREFVRGHFGRDVEIAWFRTADGYAWRHGFADREWRTRAATVPERAAFAAVGAYLDAFRPGQRKGRPLALPFALRGDGGEAGLAGDRLPNFLSEERARSLAAIIRELFGHDAVVAEDADGWLVIVDEGRGGAIGAERLAMLRGVCRLLAEYAATPAPDVLRPDGRKERAPAAAGEPRPARNGRKSAPLDRLERILESLRRIENRLGEA